MNTATADQLKSAAEMFIYLNICPGTFGLDSSNYMEQWFKSWFTFYQDLFRTQTPSQIILTLNRLMKNKSDRVMNQELFKKAATLFSLKYEIFQNMLHGGAKNVSSEGDHEVISIAKKTGKYLLHCDPYSHFAFFSDSTVQYSTVQLVKKLSQSQAFQAG